MTKRIFFLVSRVLFAWQLSIMTPISKINGLFICFKVNSMYLVWIHGSFLSLLFHSFFFNSGWSFRFLFWLESFCYWKEYGERKNISRKGVPLLLKAFSFSWNEPDFSLAIPRRNGIRRCYSYCHSYSSWRFWRRGMLRIFFYKLFSFSDYLPSPPFPPFLVFSW